MWITGGGVGDEFNSTIGVLTNGALGVGMIGKIYGSEHNFYFLSFVGGVPLCCLYYSTDLAICQ